MLGVRGAGKKRVVPVPHHFALPKNLSIGVSRKTKTITRFPLELFFT